MLQQSLFEFLLKKFPTAKRTTLRRMVEEGRVRINGVAARTVKEEVGEKDQVEVVDQPTKPDSRARSHDLEIVYEDQDLLIVNKPPGLLTSTGPKEKRPTLLARVRDYVKERDQRAPVGLIHRLDKDASGLLIFSKNNDAYRSLKDQFFDHAVKRIYHAIVLGAPAPASGRIESHLVESASGKVYSTKQVAKGQIAITEYQTIATKGSRSLLRIMLHTGRKHQIRVHLSESNHPIIGDPMYGPANTKAPRLMLVATELEITHPRTGKTMGWKLDLPPEMREMMNDRNIA